MNIKYKVWRNEMFRLINKSLMVVAVICLVTVACVFVVSCTNGVTATREMEGNKSVVSSMTRQQFVFLNYLHQLDENVVMNNLREFRATVSSIK